jgi:hypothetical protein
MPTPHPDANAMMPMAALMPMPIHRLMISISILIVRSLLTLVGIY